MNKIFSPDNPVIRLLEKVADLVILNFLTILCSLPIVTVGAALASHHKVTQDMMWDNEKPIIRSYFKAFGEMFKSATAAWLMTALILAAVIADILLIYMNFTGNAALVLYALTAIAGVTTLGAASFVYPLMARYENTLREHIRNAFILAVSNLPRTVVMLAVYAVPIVLAICLTELFIRLMIVWTLFGVSLTVLFETMLVRPVFKKLEKTPESEKDGAE